MAPSRSPSSVYTILWAIAFSSHLAAYSDHKSSTVTLKSMPQSFLKQHTAIDFCLSHRLFYCLKFEEYLCIPAGMCMTGQASISENGSVELMAVAGFALTFLKNHRHSGALITCKIISEYQFPCRYQS